MNKLSAPRRCLSMSSRLRGGAEAPPSWEQLRGAGWNWSFYHNSVQGWFPALSNTTYETELGTFIIANYTCTDVLLYSTHLKGYGLGRQCNTASATFDRRGTQVLGLERYALSQVHGLCCRHFPHARRYLNRLCHTACIGVGELPYIPSGTHNTDITSSSLF